MAATFEELFTQHKKIVFKICHLYADSEADREDMFQEIGLQAYKSFQGFKGQSQFSTWLYRVALNTAITWFKKEKKRNAALTEYAQQPVDETACNNQQFQAMYLAINQLNKIDKALVTLYLDGIDYKEIGEILGITANNVAVKINRLKIKLKEDAQRIYSSKFG